MIIKNIRVMFYEYWTNTIELVQYRKAIISEIITFFLSFIVILVFSDKGSFISYYGVQENSSVLIILIGFIYWNFGNICMGYASSVIAGDAKTGMLEIKIQSITPYFLLVFADMLVSLFIGITTLLLVLLYLSFTNDFYFSDIIKVIEILIIQIPSIIGMYGIGLLFGGISFKEKQIGQYVSLFSIVLLFISNTLIPTTYKIIYLIPFTSGVDISRDVITQHKLNFNLIITYITINIFWLFIGIVFFKFMEKKEKYSGGFNNY